MEVKEYAIQCFKDEAAAVLGLTEKLDDKFEQAVELMYDCKGKVIGRPHIAMSLARDYTDLFYVNMDTDEYVEYHTEAGFRQNIYDKPLVLVNTLGDYVFGQIVAQITDYGDSVQVSVDMQYSTAETFQRTKDLKEQGFFQFS